MPMLRSVRDARPRRFPRLCGLAVALAAAGCAGAGREQALTADRVLAHFAPVVFSDQYEPQREIGRLRKWTEPIRIALHGDEAPRFAAVIRRHAAALSPLIGLPIEVLGAPQERANFEIRFVPWDDMEKEARAFAPRPEWLGDIVEGAAGMFVFRRNERYEIVRALVLVSTRESAAHKESCLLEEMTQALGLPNDSDLLQPSIFNSFDRLTALTPADRILVQALYDPRMTPGLPRPQALALTRTIIGELLAGDR